MYISSSIKSKFKKYIKEIIVFTIMLTIAANAMSYYRSLDLNKDSLNINSFTLLNDTQYIIPSNKKIIIHFWATWCPTCKLAASNIQKLSKDYEVLTIAVQSGSNKEIQNYLDKNNLTFKVVNDEDGFYSQKFNIKAFPTTFIYSKDKKLKFSEVGYTTTLGLYLRMMLIN